MFSKQILVIALQTDLHVDSVLNHLNEKGVRVVRIDPTLDESIPEKVSIKYKTSFDSFYKLTNNNLFNPMECNGVFCRFALESLIVSSDDPLVNFSSSESLCAFLAPLRMIDSSRWINDPWIENKVDCKILQLKIADSLGLKIPDFIVSSNYNDLISFYNEYKNVIIKPLSDTPLALVGNDFVKQENLNTDNFKAPYTAKFNPNSNINANNIDNTPTLLQMEINKKSDLRVTIVDNNVFAVEMPYKEGNPIDFRLNKNDNVMEYILPDKIKEKLIELVKLLGVRFASCDLILDKNNEIYFIESNVQGNWLWTEINERMNISEIIANALIK